jgi:hypothetical protein
MQTVNIHTLQHAEPPLNSATDLFVNAQRTVGRAVLVPAEKGQIFLE